MKYLVILLIYLNSFSQDKKSNYYFDYYTVYEYKKNEKDTLKSQKEIFFFNSKDSTYILSIVLVDNIVTIATLGDMKNLKVHTFKDKINLKNYNDVRLFNSASTNNINLEQCRKNSNYNYETIDRNEFDHSIIKYTKSKKKKIVDEYIFETKPSEINTNQNYNFGPFVNPLWCWKFKLKDHGLITNSYVLIKGNKKNLRKLLETDKTDFTINIDSTTNTQQ